MTNREIGAVTAAYNSLNSSGAAWTQLATTEILTPLNMTHSFFGPIPDALIPDIGVPGGANWVELLVGTGYEPAAGMWVRLIHQPAMTLLVTFF